MGDPPNIADIDGGTQAINGFTAQLENDTFDRQTVTLRGGANAALSTLRSYLMACEPQLASNSALARSLQINEGLVGGFETATLTAKNLNKSSAQIADNLEACSRFVTALHNFINVAIPKLGQQSGE